MQFHWRKWKGTELDTLGLFAVQVGGVILHVFIKDKPWARPWMLGRQTEPYDSCLEYFGLGPLCRFVWTGGETFMQALRDKKEEN